MRPPLFYLTDAHSVADPDFELRWGQSTLELNHFAEKEALK